MGRVLAGEHVAVCDDGDVRRGLDLPDDVPVGLPGVHLHPGAAVDRQGVRPGLLQGFGKVHGVHAAAVPALAEFHRHGDGDRRLYGLHDPACQLRVAHQGRAVAGFDDLPHGAAHIDVQHVRPRELQRQSRRLRHDLRLVAEDLHGAGMLVLRQVQQRPGLFVLIDQSLGRDHLRGGQGRPLRPAEGAKGKVRHPGHGGQGHPALQLYVSDMDPLIVQW